MNDQHPCVDSEFRANVAVALPDAIDRLVDDACDAVAQQLTLSLARACDCRHRLGYLATTLLELGTERLRAATGAHQTVVTPLLDNQTRADDCPPFVRTFSWFVSATVAGDRDTAAAALAAIPDNDLPFVLPKCINFARYLSSFARQARS